MVSKKLKVVNSQGFHMRPASVFAQEMSKFSADVQLQANGMTVSGKSVMALIAACLKFGTEIEVQCSGADEEEALDKAVSLIESGLGEE